MACHVCGGEAVGRCFSCGRLFCEKHGSKNCVTCENGIAEGNPSPDRVTAKRSRVAHAAAWWRPVPADDYSPPACYVCKSLTRAVCSSCGRNYCAEHAGRKSTCLNCNDPSNVSIYVVGGFLLAMMFFVLVAAWLG